MDIVTLDIFRTVAEGEANPNTKIVYENMSDKINEAIQQHHGRLPIVRSIDPSKTLLDKMTIDSKDVVGYVTGIADDIAHCELNIEGTELLKRAALFDKTIQFWFLPKTTEPAQVDTVLNAALAPMPCTRMFHIERSSDIDILQLIK